MEEMGCPLRYEKNRFPNRSKHAEGSPRELGMRAVVPEVQLFPPSVETAVPIPQQDKSALKAAKIFCGFAGLIEAAGSPSVEGVPGDEIEAETSTGVELTGVPQSCVIEPE